MKTELRRCGIVNGRQRGVSFAGPGRVRAWRRGPCSAARSWTRWTGGGVLGEHPGGDRGARAHRLVRAGVEGAAAEAPGSVRAAACDRPAGVADLRGHRGPGRRLGLGDDLVILRGHADRAGRFPGLRAWPARAAGRPQVLPQPAVFRRDRDRGVCDGRARRVPAPQHLVPAGGPRLPAAYRRVVPGPDGRGDGCMRPAGRSDGRPARDPGAAADRRCRG